MVTEECILGYLNIHLQTAPFTHRFLAYLRTCLATEMLSLFFSLNLLTVPRVDHALRQACLEQVPLAQK